MHHSRKNTYFAVFFSLALHAAVLALASHVLFEPQSRSPEPLPEQVIFTEVLPPPPPPLKRNPVPPAAALAPDIALPSDVPRKQPALQKQAASMEAPPPPTAEEWAFAAQYTNKNSKGYRYSWGQQVRSMMGTAVEGPDQGYVRFRIEIAPNGTLTRLETLWSTSAVAEARARKAIETMAALPATPTGKPLIFEKTIAFTPFASDDPPSYRDDCLPDPPAFKNPFAWDGKSPQTRDDPPQPHKLDPQALEECMRQLPKDSIEAEMARDKRAMERWNWK